MPTAPATAPCRQKPRPRMTPGQRHFAVSHLGLAQQQARRFAIRHDLDFEDVLGVAYEGLCKAALGFDAERGFRPSSYVVPKVKGELLHHLRDTGFALRISHRYRELWVKARRGMALGWSDGELAEALGIALAEWLQVRRACGQRALSLEGEVEAEMI
jgi:DNA-directed RNA polymerase specialized sigma subunit